MTLSQATAYMLGFTPENIDAVCIARGGAIKRGQVVALCIMDAEKISEDFDGETVTTREGVNGSMFANVTAVYSNDAVECGIFGVALDNIADSTSTVGIQKGRVRFAGISNAWMNHGANGAISIGSHFYPGTDGVTDSTNPGSKRGYGNARGISGAADTRKLIGLSLQAATSITMGTATSVGTSEGGGLIVLFDGINGLGGTNS